MVGILELDLRLDGCFSLKDKRQILRSLLDKSRRNFQVSIAEVGDQDLWNSARIGASAVSNDPHHAESVLSHVLNLFDLHPSVAVEASSMRMEGGNDER